MAGSSSDHVTSHVHAKKASGDSENATITNKTSKTTLTSNPAHKRTNATRISRSTTLRECPVQSNHSTGHGNWRQKSCSGACGLYKFTDYLDICQCDDLCFVNGDCCPDMEQVCPQLTPHPEARKTRCWGYYPIFDGEVYPLYLSFNWLCKKQGRIHRKTVEDGWAGAVMRKLLAIQKFDRPTDR